MLWLGLSLKKTFVMFGIKISVLAAKNTAGKICRYSLKHPVLSHMAAKCPGGVILTNTDIPQIYVYLTFLKI